jgi:hypothetical protein
VSRQHYGALGGVILGYVFCRIFAFWVVDVMGAVGGHHRGADIAVGAAFAAVPFAVLVAFTVLQLRHRHVLDLRPVKAFLVVGWVAAGAVMAMLPYSRAGTSTDLRSKEFHAAPGFLHGVDSAIFVGLLVTVGLLLLALRSRQDHSSPPIEWLEHQLEDDR